MFIIDNYLDEETFNGMKNTMLSSSFPWNYAQVKSGKNTHNTPQEEIEHYSNQQMYHEFHGFEHAIHKTHSQTMKIIWPLLKKIQPAVLGRIKANLQFHTQTQYQSPFHTDMTLMPKDVPYYTAVFYLNTNDGYTILEDTDEKIYSYENRFVVFDGHRAHAGSTCTDSKIRAVINLNFIPSVDTKFADNIIYS